MKFCRAPCFLFVFVWLAGVLHAQAVDRNAFTFTDYNLDARVEPEQQRLGVRGTVSLRNDSNSPQKYAVLQLSSSLDWRSIQVNGKSVPFVGHPYISDIDHTGALSEAIVTLPQEIPPKSSVQFAVGYEGVLLQDTTRVQRIGMPKDIARRIEWDRIGPDFSGVRGVGHVVWFPIATDAANFAEGTTFAETTIAWKARHRDSRMQLRITVPGASTKPPLIVLSNSPLCRRQDADGGAQPGSISCIFNPIGALEPPAFFLGSWRMHTVENTTIFTLPGHEEMATAYAGALSRTAPLVRGWFGPMKRAVQVVDVGSALGTAFEAGGGILLMPFSTKDDPHQAESNLVHELTHAAFASARPWISEGLAHFAQALWREQEGNRKAALEFLDLHLPSLVDAEKEAAADPPRSSLVDSLLMTTDEQYYRSKAMYVWWMLRDMLGEGSLKKALHGYHAQDDKQPLYLEHLLEKQSGRDLQWFFDDWVYQDRGLPDLRIASAYPRRLLGSGYVLTVTIENLGKAGAEVPLKVLVEGGEVTRRIEVRAQSQASLRIELPAKPNEVLVNDGSVPESDLGNNSFKLVN